MILWLGSILSEDGLALEGGVVKIDWGEETSLL